MAQDLQSLIGKRYDLVKIVRKQRSGWNVGIIPSFLGGINDKLPADLIEDTQTSIIENLSFLGGTLKSDTGYIEFASQLDDVAKGLFEHKSADGSAVKLCVTNKTVYKYNITEDEWQVIKGLTSTTLSANMSGGATSATVTSEAGFTVGAVFAVVLDDGTQMIREVGSTAANTINFTPAAPGSGVIATSANNVIEGAELSGDDDNQVVFTPVPGNEWTAFTNGVDGPLRYEATADTVVSIASLSSGTLAADTVCKTMVMYKSTLILLNLIEAGVYRPYKYQWSVPGTPTNWTGGNSGNNSLLDSRDHIRAAKPIGTSLAVYTSNGITMVTYQGKVGAFFRADTAVYGEAAGSQGVGAVSPNAVFALPDQAVIQTSDGIYLYRGGASVELLSDDVFKGTFGAQGDMDGNALAQNFNHFFNRTNEVFFFYRSTSSTAFPDKALVFDLSTKAFRKRKFTDEIACAGDISDTPTAVTINDLVGTIDEQSWLLGGDAIVTGIGTVLLGTVTSLYAMEYNYITVEDAGTIISWEFQTKDFDGVDKYLTLDWVEFDAAAIAATVSYSTDRGATWIDIGDITIPIPSGGGRRGKQSQADPHMTPRRFHISTTAQRFRFRVAGTGGGAEFGKMAFRFKETFVTP